MNLTNVLAWVGARLGEPSTWAGVAAAAGAVAATLQSGAGLTAAVVAGVAAVLLPEKSGKSGS